MSALMHLAISAQGFIADGGNSPSDVDPTTGKGPEWGEAAPIGLLVIVLLCVAVYFLVKSMNRNIKKVPDSFVMAGAPAPVAASVTGSVAGSDRSAESPSEAGRGPGEDDLEPPTST